MAHEEIDFSDDAEIISGSFDTLDGELIGLWPFDGKNINDTDVGKSVKKVVKSKITKAVAGGLAIAFPPVGVPAVTGLVIADRAIDVAEGMRGTPKQQAAMKKAISRTAVLSKSIFRKPPEKRTADEKAILHAGQTLATAKLLKNGIQRAKAQGGKPVSGVLVTDDGHVKRGRFSSL